MTNPQYINELAALYTRMHKHPGEERPLTEKFDVPKEAEECEEENTKASLAIKLVRELLDEEEHNEAAANAIYFIRDLVK